MKFNIFKRAFSLTELLIVLVVVAVLFAAMAPLMTKRNRGETSANEPVWMYVKDDPQKSAFYDSGSSSNTATAFIGLDPQYLTSDYMPYSKVVLKVKEGWQNMIQFRTGNDGNGTLAGVFTATPKDNGFNMVLGSRMKGEASNNYNELVSKGTDNSIVGMNAATKMAEANKSTVVGASSSMGGVDKSALSEIVAVGANSNLYSKLLSSVAVGANTSKAETSRIENTVAIGANTLMLPTSSGNSNVLVGYNVGSVGIDSGDAQANVILNSSYYGKIPKNNTIIGYKVYEGGANNAENLTAIGTNACASFSGDKTKGTTTCIGYQSAQNYGNNSATKNLGWENDKYDHIFLGGKPNGGFGGRSTLEIHNIPNTNSSTAFPKNVGPTVVMNSHLVVRGNLYVPDSNTGQVAAFQFIPVYTAKSDSEIGKSRCGKCWWQTRRRKKWRTSGCSEWIKIVIGAILVVGGVLGAVFTGGASLALAAEIVLYTLSGAGILGGGHLTGEGVGSLFGGKDWERTTDPATMSALAFMYSNIYHSGMPATYCSTSFAPYFMDRAYCPNVLRTSDLRLKDNISPNHDALSKILQVKPYQYTYKSDKNAVPQVGVMAQDLLQYFETAVSVDANGYKNIRWDEMFFATINSVKSLDNTVEKLNSDIIVMESDVSDVAKDQKSIKNRIKNINDRISKLEKNK